MLEVLPFVGTIAGLRRHLYVSSTVRGICGALGKRQLLTDSTASFCSTLNCPPLYAALQPMSLFYCFSLHASLLFRVSPSCSVSRVFHTMKFMANVLV